LLIRIQTYCLIWIAGAIIACQPETPLDLSNELPGASQVLPKEINHLALGDSYTAGEGVPYEDSWPAQLAAALTNALQIPVATKVIAETGMTTSELQQRWSSENLVNTYNLITLQIGVNDQFRGNSTATFQTDFIKLLQTIVAFNQGVTSEIVVISIPDWGVTPFGTNWDQEKVRQEIDQFNLILRTVCTQNDIQFIDITGVSRSSESDWSLVTQDGLHPSAKMYERWVSKMLLEILQSIRKAD
jgi:lysophospholipase L1-like esterase